MARSKEALLRRAEKRGRSLGEQMKVDGLALDKEMEQASIKKAKKSDEKTSSAPINKNEKTVNKPNISTTKKGEIQSKTNWKCKFCNNSNFPYRVNCNRCMRSKELSLNKE